MKKHILAVTMLTALFLTSCTETSQQENNDAVTTESVESATDDIVTSSLTDKAGKKLDMTFNNTEGTATLNLEGEIIELTQQRSGSGIWYTNDHYELRGKGNDLDLKKDGNVIFTHKDDIVTSSLKNSEGQTLDMTFNNTTNQAKIYLDGGEEIELVGQKPASGIWYKNDQYELRGKGEDVELTKDGVTVFKK